MTQNPDQENLRARAMRHADEKTEGRKIAVAYLVGHPIQYEAPLLRLISAQTDIDLTIFFRSAMSVRRFHDPGFGRMIVWYVPLLDGYRFEFLCQKDRNDSGDWKNSTLRSIAWRLWSGRFDVLWIHGFSGWKNTFVMIAARLASTRC